MRLSAAIPMMLRSATHRVAGAWPQPSHNQHENMLRGLRTASTGWLGKTIMAVVVGVLVIAFAAWGIGDIFRGYSRSYVAVVGSSSITPDQFRQLYQNKLQDISRQLRRPITPDQ